FKDKTQELQWTQQQRTLLLESKATEVITNITNLGNGKNPSATQLVAYFQSNLHRMNVIKPVIDKVFPFEQTNEAMSYVEAGRAKGKVVVKFK
ncbi:MAG: zinc-binding dehydrogenase, partial [Ferruginibacter sp.]